MSRTTSTLFWFSLIIVASLGLYRTSDRVQQLDHQLRTINASIDLEKQSIHVLKAEWGYLDSPTRIEAISRKHLALRPTSPQQVATLTTLSEIIPTRAEAMSTVAVNSTPMANIKTTLAAHLPPPPALALYPVKKAKPLAVAAYSEHVRDHMIMVQHTASAAPLPGDTIGSLIEQLGTEQ